MRDLGARRGWVVSATPGTLYPRERPDTRCTGGWVGPRAGLDVCENLAPPGFDPRTAHTSLKIRYDLHPNIKQIRSKIHTVLCLLHTTVKPVLSGPCIKQNLS
jgi:hypothetical protein